MTVVQTPDPVGSSYPVLLIPAYNPGPAILETARTFRGLTDAPIVVVDDGSDDSCRHLFDELARIGGIDIVRHAVNLGKGYALRTGINHILLTHGPDDAFSGVVTADADGQHLPADIVKMIGEHREAPGKLILGARSFGGDTPFRSRLGNILTRIVFTIIMGVSLSDTQTGLRAIPRRMLPLLLHIRANRYEYELEMLALAVGSGFQIAETTISTVYIDNNAASHFRPIVDSAKIYFVFLRFIAASLMTSVFEYCVFTLAYINLGVLSDSQIVSRTFAIVASFFLSKKFVFHSRKKFLTTFLPFALLVILFGFISYSMINYMVETFNTNIFSAKLISELILYIPNFIIQKFMFSNEGDND